MADELDDLLNEINSLENQIKSVESDLRFSGSILSEGQTTVTPAEVSRIMWQNSPEKTKAVKQAPTEQKFELNVGPSTSIQMTKAATPQNIKEEIKSAVKTEERVNIPTPSKLTPNVQAPSVQPATKEQQVIQIPSVQYTASDIPSLGFLIKRLSELIDINSKISEELQEIIATSSKADASKRLASLINKLAYASIYG